MSNEEGYYFKNGGRMDFFLTNAYVEIVRTAIAEYGLTAVAQEKAASTAAVAMDGGAVKSVRDANIGAKPALANMPRTGPCSGGRCGGIRVPHVHYEENVYLLTDKQWNAFSQKVIKNFQDKLSNAKGVNFEQLMKLSEAMGDIVTSE